MEPRRCGAQTLSGQECRRVVKEGSERCNIHTGPQCSVCLGCMNAHSATRTIDCGHEFHERCLARWKASCMGPEPTCPMCRTSFDVPLYRCRLIIERVSDGNVTNRNFEVSNVMNIVQGFGLDFRQLVPASGGGRVYTDIHFDIEPGEVLEDILRELGLN